jgi:hypothetical protein
VAFLALLIGSVFIVAAIRDTHGQLFAALREDVPAFAIWGAAILGVAAIGYIPGLKPVSRGLLALVVVVLILNNYRQVLGGFQGAAFGAVQQAAGGGDEQKLNATWDALKQMGETGGVDFSDLLSADTSGGETAVNG